MELTKCRVVKDSFQKQVVKVFTRTGFTPRNRLATGASLWTSLFLLCAGCASSRPPLVSDDLVPTAYSASGAYEQVEPTVQDESASESVDSRRLFHPALAFDGDARGENSYWNSGG